MSQLNLNSFVRLMKSNQDGDKMAFFKKTYSTKDHEFLLIHSNMLIDIRGDINITHLYQMDEIMDAIGEILPM